MDLVSGDRYDNVNPWYVRDGKWGGFGETRWFRAERHGFPKGDVLEWHFKEGRQEWWRVWVDAENRWRELTLEEVGRLPVFKPHEPVFFDKTVSFPVSFKTPEAQEAVASVLMAPLSQVIQQAPILMDLFSKTC